MARPTDVTADCIARLNKRVPRGDGLTTPNRWREVKELAPAPAADWLSALGPLPTAFSFVQRRPASPVLDDLSLSGARFDLPEAETFVLELPDAKGRPRLFAVWCPKDIKKIIDPKVGALSFLVMFSPLIRQNIEVRFGGSFNTDPGKKGRQTRTGFYVGYPELAMDPATVVSPSDRTNEDLFHPRGWDYLFYQIWQKLNYKSDPVIQPHCHGFPYQIAAARTGLALVVPLVTAADDVGDFVDPANFFRTLRLIQYEIALRLEFPLSIATPPLGPIAVGAFSAGNRILKRLLDGLGAWSEVSEVYMFDPPNDVGEEVIASAVKWARTIFSPTLRLYTNTTFKGVASIVSAAPSNLPRVNKSTDGRRSVAMFTPKAWAQLIGAHIKASPAFRKANDFPGGLNPKLTDPVQIGEEFLRKNSGSSFHQYMPALMLTDALTRSAFPRLP